MLESNCQIRAGALAGPLAGLKAIGSDVSQVLACSEVSVELVSNPEAILDADNYVGVMERARHAAPTDSFMVQTGIGMPLGEMGISGLAILSATTVRDALFIAQDVLSYIQSGSRLPVSTARGRCRVRYNQGLGTGREIDSDIQYTAGIIANLVRSGLHGFDPELTVYYPDAQNSHIEGLPSGIKFRSSTEGFVEFDERALHSPMPLANSDRAAVLKSFLIANTIDQASSQSLTETVSQLIYHSVGIVRPAQTEIASMLGMNGRALQRALKAEGFSYRQLLESNRRTIAMEDLMNGESVTQTALKLGYDYPQNFTSAFQDWFGHAPSSV